MKISDWAQDILDSYEKQTSPFNEAQVFDSLSKARKARPDLTDEEFEGFRAEVSAFFFYERREEDSVWNTYFAPTFTAKREDGTEFRSPEIRELNADVIAHWAQRAQTVSNPLMRARYADLVWDLNRVITGVRRRSPEHARIAIDAYLEAADKRFYTMEVEGIRWVGRALDLSLSLNDEERTRRVVGFMFEFYDRIAQPQHIGTWLFLFDDLFDKNELLTLEQQARIISNLEAMLAKTSDRHNPSTFDPWGAEAAAQRLAQHYQREKNKNEVKRVIRSYGESFERLAKDASPMLAMAWLQPVIEKYEQAGLRDEAEHLQVMSADKGKNIDADMKQISVNFELKVEDIEKATDALTSKDLTTSLGLIAAEFVPDVNRAKKTLADIRTGAPLLALIGVVKVENGRISARAGSVDEDPQGRLYMQLAETIRINQLFLLPALAKLKERYKPSAEDILKFIYECPLFLEERRRLLSEGVTAYLQDDFVKTVHVLVPQIEQALRNLLAIAGVPVDKTVRGEPGIMDKKSMNEVLGEERLRAAIPENLWRYLYALYVERKGLNLRNRLAHGLVDAREFNPQMADQVFHSLLALSILRKAEGEQPKAAIAS